MRRALLTTIVAATCLITAPAALATTETAQAGNVTATFTFQGKFPNYSGQTLQIAQGGTVFYDAPVVSNFCAEMCAPGITGKSAVDVVDLEHTGSPTSSSISTAAERTAARSCRSSRSTPGR